MSSKVQSEWPEVTRRKLNAVRRRSNRACGLSESNPRYDMRANYAGYSMTYGYQRVNLKFTDPFRDQPYSELGLSPRSNQCFLLFTTCGQSATATVFVALKALGFRNVQSKSIEPYYETRDVLYDFGIKLRVAKGACDVFLIDSSNFEEAQDRMPRSKYVVIDTTCWALSDRLISKISKRAIAKGSLVILVRSHLKLDSNGVEFGRLGSIVVLGKKTDRRFEPLVKNISLRSTNLGSRAEVASLYPHLRTRNFHSGNRKWIDSIRRGNRAVAEELRLQIPKDFAEIVEFDHGLFFWIRFHTLPFKLLTARELVLEAAIRKSGVPSRIVASFPWDFAAITCFEQKTVSGKMKANVMRLSMPSIRMGQSKTISSAIIDWLGEMQVLEAQYLEMRRSNLSGKSSRRS